MPQEGLIPLAAATSVALVLAGFAAGVVTTRIFHREHLLSAGKLAEFLEEVRTIKSRGCYYEEWIQQFRDREKPLKEAVAEAIDRRQHEASDSVPVYAIARRNRR